jgi:hypothetical protein
MAVAAPSGQQQVARFEQLVQVVDQEGFIVGQRAILEVESSPVEAVEVQPKQLQGMAAFQWALMAQAALWPVNGWRGCPRHWWQKQAARPVLVPEAGQPAGHEDLSSSGCGASSTRRLPGRAQLLAAGAGQLRNAARRSMVCLGGLYQVLAHSCYAPAGEAGRCRPNSARSRSAWLWRMYTGRSALSRAKWLLQQNGVAPTPGRYAE